MNKEQYLLGLEDLLHCAYEDIVRCESISAGDKFLRDTLKKHEVIEDYDMCIIIRDFITAVDIAKTTQKLLVNTQVCLS